MAHRAATDEICVTGVWGTPHQAKGGDSSESPPGVFWLQKTLLATFVGNLTLLGESVVPCLQDLRSNERNQIEVDLDQYYPVYRARSKSIIKPSQVRYVLP